VGYDTVLMDHQALRITQIDAFTDRPFGGNPAAVVVLDAPADARWMQSVATEVNLSETAFLWEVPGEGRVWSLRWFTPSIEVDLCGHATLASAHHLFTDHGATEAILQFDTRSGRLTARRLPDSWHGGGWIELDLPADATMPIEPPDRVLDALGVADPVAVVQGRTHLLVEVAEAAIVRSLDPDHRALRATGVRGVIVTAAGDDGDEFDVVSRYFAPGAGIDEDPVTGAAHCTLGPYWGAKLGRKELLAHQASARGGVLRITLDDTGGPASRQRVRLAGQAVHAFGRS
jgi:PhzF family phenazine biosynthesis protein